MTRTGAACAWCGRDGAAVCCVPPGWTVVPDPGLPGAGLLGTGLPGAGADLGGAGLGAAVLAGMSSGEGACAFDGAGLLCSVIGWLPCHGARAVSPGGRPRSPRGGIKKPLVPGGSRGVRAGTGLVSSLRASQVRECGSASRIPPSPTSRPLVKLSRPLSQHSRQLSPRGTPPYPRCPRGMPFPQGRTEVCFTIWDGQTAGTPGLDVPLTSEAEALPAAPDSKAPVLISASTPGAAMGLATRKPCP